jgi:hypothetical protein
MIILAVASWAAEPDARQAIAPLGTDQLASIDQLTFTFNVERDGALKSRRQWTWTPATGAVQRTVDGVSLAFVAGAPTTEDEQKADRQFVNDSFWLLPHLHARWAGEDLTVTDLGVAALPNAKAEARKIVLQYAPNAGGYTPGDAYDLYLDGAGRIITWGFRQGGGPEASIVATFESYQQVGPLTVATDHRTADGSLRVYFTDLAVTLRQ